MITNGGSLQSKHVVDLGASTWCHKSKYFTMFRRNGPSALFIIWRQQWVGHPLQHCAAASILLIIALLSTYESGANMQ